MLSGGELSYPGRIDAHLLNAAMDGATIQLTVGGTKVTGKLDLADGFGQIAFLPGSPHARSLEAGTPVEVRYDYKGRVWWFCARLFNRPSRNRWALLRPMRVFYKQNAE
ncbi:MAG: hypothetical protein ACI8RZ_005182 [Myxococcota bacterium]|jgi:hypothetical protein